MTSMDTDSEDTLESESVQSLEISSNHGQIGLVQPFVLLNDVLVEYDSSSSDLNSLISSASGNSNDDIISVASNTWETSSLHSSHTDENVAPESSTKQNIDIENQENTSHKRARIESENEEDGQNCPICLDGWTNSGDHRLCCLKCGHLFGHSCIIRWLQSQSKKSCPTCKKRVLKSDIRFIYAKHLVAIDTSELDQIKENMDGLVEEKNKIQLELSKSICREHSLNEEIKDLKSQLNTYKNNPLLFSSSNNFTKHLNQTVSNLRLYMNKSLEVSNMGGCRVFDTNSNLDLIMVNIKSPNPLFAGFGLRKISISQYKPLAFLPLHSAQIRDVSFQDVKVLTVSMDKSFKITDSNSNSNICSCNQESPLWSCCWDASDNNYFYIGTQMGSIIKYDIRQWSSSLCALAVPGDFSPVVSVAHIPNEGGYFPRDGIVSCKLNSLWFFENTSSAYSMHPLSLEGPFYSMKFNRTSKQLLVSSRPNHRNPNSRHHLVNLYVEGDKIGTNSLHTFDSIGLQRHLSRSCFIEGKNNHYIATHEESSKLVTLWNINNGTKETSVPAHDPVLDLNYVQNCKSMCLIGLTDKKMLFYNFSSDI